MPRLILTHRGVRTLTAEPRQARTIYFDQHRDAPKGFALRVTATGARSYYLIQTLKGSKQRLWVHLGDAMSISLDDARRAAWAKAGDIARDKNPNQLARAAAAELRAEQLQRVQDAEEPTLAELLRRYLAARLSVLSVVTAKEYGRLIKVEIEPSPLGSLKARELVRADVRDFLVRVMRGQHTWKTRAERRPAPYVAAHLLALLRAGYKWAQLEEVRLKTADGKVVTRPLVDRMDPTLGVEKDIAIPVRARERERHLSDIEIPLLWRSLERLKPAWAAFVRIVLLLGTRRGETHRARWSDIELDSEAPVWRIPAADRKGRTGDRRPLDVPLSPKAVELLRAVHHVTRLRERVFVAHGFSVGLVGDEVKRALREAADEASGPAKKVLEGMADVTIHDLRRSVARGLERLGAPPHVISLALGHAHTKGATASDHHYIGNVRPTEVREWLERWSSHVGGLLGEGRPAKIVAFDRRA